MLFSFLTTLDDHLEQPCTRSELLHCSHRIFRAVSLIQQATTTHYLRKASVQVREREDRLRGFNRMISHELKNDLGAIAGAHALLGESWLDPESAGLLGWKLGNLVIDMGYVVLAHHVTPKTLVERLNA